MQSTKKILSVLLAAAMLLCMLPAGVFAAQAEPVQTELRVAVLSDVHFYAQEDMGGKNEAWQVFEVASNRQHEQTPALVQASLDQIAADPYGYQVLLVSGDLTRNGEPNAHKEFAAMLESFQAKSGIPVFVTNGNHDINNHGAVTFKNGKQEFAGITTPQAFREIYKNLGFDKADSFYKAEAGNSANSLSYAADLSGDVRLLVLDTNKYSADATDSGEDKHETGGAITEGLLTWLQAECAKAKKDGKMVIGMMHHNIVPSFGLHAELFQDFPVDDWMEFAEPLADAGLHYVFTGHTHMDQVESHISDNGQIIYDIMTASLTGYPSLFRRVTFKQETSGVQSADIYSMAPDRDAPIEVDGVAYSSADKPYSNYSFYKTYGENGLHEFAMVNVKGMLGDLFADITQQGGLLAMLKNSGVDLEQILVDAIGEGLALGSLEIFTVKQNLMAFIEDLCAQVDALYIKDPTHLYELVDGVVAELLAMPVSDLPNNYYLDTLGFGSATEPGTFEDLAYSVIAHVYSSNCDMQEDAFLLDGLAYFEEGTGAEDLFNLLRRILVNDLIEDEILSSLKFNPGKLFPQGTLLRGVGIALEVIFGILLFGDNSYMNLVSTVFGIIAPFLGFGSLDDVIDYFADEYLTESQFESLGWIIGYMLRGLMEDNTPNRDVTCQALTSYTVPTSKENHRLPTNVAITFGETQDALNMLWFTKYSVDGTDIELVPYSETPQFTGKATEQFVVSATSEALRRSYPGVDIGIIGFMDYTFTMQRHELQLKGLAPGAKYSYRIGDAKRGWWSEAGTITVPDASDKLTFIHVTDPQSQTPVQYKTFANVIEQAYALFPQAGFLVNTGDHVDNGTNFKHWKWLLNGAADTLGSTVMMPTTGNHENKESAIPTNFLLTGMPQQDTETGVYYSYDYNNAHFVVLNTNDLAEDGTLGETQLAWLKADMAANTKPWTILSMHKALYSNGSHYDDSDVVALREQLGALLPELGVDLVLAGHDHVYTRTDILDGNKVIKSEESTVHYDGKAYTAKRDPQGTVYAISGCSGVKSYKMKDVSATDKLFPRPEKIVDTQLPVFSAVTIDGDTLYFDAYTVDGDETDRIDGFALTKTTVDGGKEEPTKPGEGGGEEQPTKPAEEKPTNPDNTTTSPETTPPKKDTDAQIPQTGDTPIVWLAVLPMVSLAYFVWLMRHGRRAGKQKED